MLLLTSVDLVYIECEILILSPFSLASEQASERARRDDLNMTAFLLGKFIHILMRIACGEQRCEVDSFHQIGHAILSI